MFDKLIGEVGKFTSEIDKFCLVLKKNLHSALITKKEMMKILKQVIFQSHDKYPFNMNLRPIEERKRIPISQSGPFECRTQEEIPSNPLPIPDEGNVL